MKGGTQPSHFAALSLKLPIYFCVDRVFLSPDDPTRIRTRTLHVTRSFMAGLYSLSLWEERQIMCAAARCKVC